jgi:hypothetical protein
MTGGEKLLIAGAVGVVGLALLKARANASAPPPTTATGGPAFSNIPTGTVVAPSLSPTFGSLIALFPYAPQVSALAAVSITPVVNDINKAIDGANPYGGLTKNANGTFTDGMGCIITFHADGSYDRNCGGYFSHITPKLKAIGNAATVVAGAVASSAQGTARSAANAADTVGSAVKNAAEGTLRSIKSIF